MQKFDLMLQVAVEAGYHACRIRSQQHFSKAAKIIDYSAVPHLQPSSFMRSNCGPGHPSGVETELPLVYSAALAGGQTVVMMPYVKHVKSVNVMYCIPFVSFASHLLNPLSTSCLRNRSAWLECSISCR